MCRLRQEVLHPSQRRRLPPTPSNFTPKFPTMPSRAYSICRVHLQLSTLCVRWKHKSNNLSIKPLVTKVRPVLGWPTAAVVSRVRRAPTRLCNPNPNHAPLFTHGNAVAGDYNPTGGWGYTRGVQWLQVRWQPRACTGTVRPPLCGLTHRGAVKFDSLVEKEIRHRGTWWLPVSDEVRNVSRNCNFSRKIWPKLRNPTELVLPTGMITI